MEEKQIKFEEWGTPYIETDEKKYLATKDDVEQVYRELNELRYGDCKIREIPTFGEHKHLVLAYLFVFLGFIFLSQALRRSL